MSKIKLVTVDVDTHVNKSQRRIVTQASYKFVSLGNTYEFKTKAQATCHPDDKFEVELGTRISEGRCHRKALIKVSKILESSASLLVESLSEIGVATEKYTEALTKESNHLDDLMKS